MKWYFENLARLERHGDMESDKLLIEIQVFHLPFRRKNVNRKF